MDELERAPEDTTGVVDLLGGEHQPFLVREGVDGGDSTVGVDLADADRVLLRDRRSGRTKQSKQETQQAKRTCRSMRFCRHGLCLLGREQRYARESMLLQRHESPRQSSTND